VRSSNRRFDLIGRSASGTASLPHNSKVRGWTITPAHFLNQQLDTVWLAE